MGEWKKRDPVSNLVVLGDDEGQAKKAAGLLASLKQDSQYPSRSNYELVQKDGTSVWLAGSASIGRQVFPADVGKFVKATFKGWGNSANGKFKDIEVLIYDGEPTAEMKKWPRWAEVNAAPKKGAKAEAEPAPEPAPAPTDDDFSDFPEAVDALDDGLPFD